MSENEISTLNIRSVRKYTIGFLSFIYFFLLSIIFTLLSLAYYNNFGDLLLVNDFWFGADVNRHIFWVIDPIKNFRSHLHPISFVVFKGQGWLLNVFNVLPGKVQLPFISFPIIIYTSISIIFCSVVLFPFKHFPFWMQLICLVMLIFIGPLLVFAPVPESHVLGGVSLLMQAVLIWLWLHKHKKDENKNKSSEGRLILGGIFLFAFLAAGFTLSNLMPATIMMFAISEFRRPILKLAVSGGFFLLVIALVHFFFYNMSFITRTGSKIFKETAWLIIPDFSTMFISIKNVLITQFGLSMSPEIQDWYYEGEMMYYIEQNGPTLFQIIAFLCWIAGIVFWLIRHENKSHQNVLFIKFTSISLFSIVVFHTFYASAESYIFSAHAWPYLILPGLLAFRNSWLNKDYWPILFLFFALGISMMQMFAGLKMLLSAT